MSSTISVHRKMSMEAITQSPRRLLACEKSFKRSKESSFAPCSSRCVLGTEAWLLSHCPPVCIVFLIFFWSSVQKENFHLLQQRAEVAEEGSRYAVEKVDASVNDYPRGRDDYAPENRNRAQEEENRQFQEPEQGYGKRRDQMQGYQRQNYALAYNAPPPGHDEVPAQSKQEGKNAQILYVGQEGADEPQGAHRPEPNPPPQANATRQSVRENPLPLQRG